MSDQDNSNSDQPQQPAQTVDPLEVQLQAQSKVEESNPLDVHAQMFYMYGPRFRGQLQMMNKKALIRLINSLVQFPLNDNEIKLRSKVEQDAFHTGDQMLTSKYVMMIVTDMNTQMEAKQKEEQAKLELDKQGQDVVVSNNTEGENNG